MKTHDWETTKRLLAVIGATLSWAFTSLLFLIFYMAVFHPSNQILIDVNAYGEMGIETFVFALMWIAVTLNMILTWKGKPHDHPHKKDAAERPARFTAIPYIYDQKNHAANHYNYDEMWYKSIEHALTGENQKPKPQAPVMDKAPAAGEPV